MDIMALVARLTLDKTDYDSGLDSASEKAQGFGSKLKKGLGVATAAVTAVAGAASAMAGVVAKGVSELSKYGDNIDKMSQKLGLSAEGYQEWDAVMQHMGTSIDSMGIGMKTLANKAAAGSDAFKKLGITQAQSMSQEDLFNATITALQNMTDEAERNQLAQELLGKSAIELKPLLNATAAETQAMKDRVHELGGVMSDEAVKAAAEYKDTLQDMHTAFDGMKRNLLSEFLPGINTVMKGLTDLFTGGDGIGQISEGIAMFTEKLNEVIPRVLDTGTKIVLALADAIVANLPKLIDAATGAILTLVTGIIQQLPMIISAGLQVIVSLAQGIADSLPELIPTIVDVVLQIVDILTNPDTLSQLIDAALQIILALAEGLIKAVPKLIKQAPVIVMNLVQAIIRNAPKLIPAALQLMLAWAQGVLQGIGSVISAVSSIIEGIWDTISGAVRSAANWGKDLIKNFTAGIRAFINKPIDAIKGLAGRIKSFLGFSEPEEGPLSNFHTFAPDMMELFAKGIKDNEGLLTDAISDAFNFGPKITETASYNNAAGQTFAVPRASTPRTLTVIFECDKTQLGRMVYELNEQEQQRVGVKLATGGVY